MTVLAVNVAVRQLFRSRFADRDNFHIEVQVLTRQHVVAVNHDVLVFHFGDFNRNRTLIGFRQEAHANLQFVNAHKHVFRYALHQVVVVLAVCIVSRNMHVKLVADIVIFQRFFQTRNQGTMTVQIV